MKMYDEGNKLGIAMTSGFVETHAGNLHVYADRTQAGDIVFITAENFKKYIPIEWLKNKVKEALDERRIDDALFLKECLAKWEEENE